MKYTRVIFAKPDWIDNLNLLDINSYYNDHIHLIEEGYKNLVNTINMLFLNNLTKENIKKSDLFLFKYYTSRKKFHYPITKAPK